MLQKRIHIIVQLYLGTGIECAVCVCMDFFKYIYAFILYKKI